MALISILLEVLLDLSYEERGVSLGEEEVGSNEVQNTFSLY